MHKFKEKILSCFQGLTRHCVKYAHEWFGGLVILAIIFAIGILLSNFIPRKQPVLIELVVDRVEFTVPPHGDDRQQAESNILTTSSVSFLDLTVEGFTQIEHEGSSEVSWEALKTRSVNQKILISSHAQSNLPIISKITFEKPSPRHDQENRETCPEQMMRIRNDATTAKMLKESTIGRLSPLIGETDTKVTIESADPSANSFVIRISGGTVSTTVRLDKNVHMNLHADAFLADGKPIPLNDGNEGYDLGLKSSHLMKVVSSREGMSASFRLPCESAIQFIEEGTSTQVKNVRFERVSVGGVWASSVHSAKVRYLEHSFLKPVEVQMPIGISFDQDDEFRLEQAVTDPKTGLLQMRLWGEVSEFHTGSQQYKEDHSVSVFHIGWENPFLVTFFSVFGLILTMFHHFVGHKKNIVAKYIESRDKKKERQ